MKKLNIFNSILVVTFAFFIMSCEKDPTVKIETLSKYGKEFYYGEKVVVWAGTQGNAENLSFDWTCNGGSFSGPNTQNLLENLWIAPSVAGTYTVTVKAKDGEVSDTRTTDMYVSRYFFDNFDNSLNNAGWSSSNTTLAWKTTTIPTRVEFPATSTSAPYFRRTLTSNALVPPFSIRSDLGYTKYRSVGTSDVTGSNLPLYISLYFVQPTENQDKPYIREIRWEILPNASGTKANWRIRAESYVPATNKSNFAANGGTNLPIPEPFAGNVISGRSNLFAFGANAPQKFTITMDKDANGKITFSAYVNGTAWIDKSYAIQNFLDVNGLDQSILVVKEFRVTGPRLSNSSASSGETTLYLNSVYINDGNSYKSDGTLGFEDLGTVTTY